MALASQCRLLASYPKPCVSKLSRFCRSRTRIRAVHTDHQPDEMLRFISGGSSKAEVSVLAIAAQGLVADAIRRHSTAPTASAALGRALIGSLLIAGLKDEAETLHVTFAGRGPLGQMSTVTTKGRLVKGFVANPLCHLPLTPSGKLDVGTAVGAGVLTVSRSSPSSKQPYTGAIPIYSGEVAEDLGHYLSESEQINSAIGVGVAFGNDGSVKAARGYLVQVLPFCSEQTLMQLEENIARLPSLSDASVTLNPRDIVDRILGNIGVGELCEEVTPEYGPCEVEELKPRMMRVVASLGAEDVKELIRDYGYVEVKCEFCAETVRFKEEELQGIICSNKSSE